MANTNTGRSRVAAHEAGHALTAALCPALEILRFSYAGAKDGETSFRLAAHASHEQFLEIPVIILGGLGGEHAVYGESGGLGGAIGDFLQAVSYAAVLFSEFEADDVLRGWTEADRLPKGVLAQIDIEGEDPGVLQVLGMAYRKARRRIEARSGAFDAIRGALVRSGAIDGRKIARLVARHPAKETVS